jgi:NTP pyrophosphatase (non-canonical NTP hydrolase)
MMKSDIDLLTDKLVQFRDERNWAQFHNGKDLALALSVEAAELLELFLWKNEADADPDRLKEELADVFAFAILFAEKYQFNVRQIVLDKIESNRNKYPVDLAKGNAKKYTDLTNGTL